MKSIEIFFLPPFVSIYLSVVLFLLGTLQWWQKHGNGKSPVYIFPLETFMPLFHSGSRQLKRDRRRTWPCEMRRRDPTWRGVAAQRKSHGSHVLRVRPTTTENNAQEDVDFMQRSRHFIWDHVDMKSIDKKFGIWKEWKCKGQGCSCYLGLPACTRLRFIDNFQRQVRCTDFFRCTEFCRCQQPNNHNNNRSNTTRPHLLQQPRQQRKQLAQIEQHSGRRTFKAHIYTYYMCVY